MTKIVFIVESLDVGGTELSLLKWLQHCDRNVFAPSVIAFNDGILREELNRLSVPNMILFKKRPFDILFLRDLVSHIRAAAPDVVHCRNGIPAISYGVIASRLARVPVVCSIHGRTHYIRQDFRTWLWFRIMRWSQCVITVTEGIAQEVSQYGKIPLDKIKIIYNGIDWDGRTVPPSREALRRGLGFSSVDFLIGSVGNLRTIKGQKYLIQAMPKILGRIGSARIVLIGQGQEEQNLKNLSRELGIDDKIHFLGYKKNAGGLIGMFDVFALPSLSEGFPNVLLEAATAGVPVVATNVGGVPEVVRHEREALLVHPSDANAIAVAIVQLAEQPALRNTLMKNAAARVKECFDIQNTWAQYNAVYSEFSGKISNSHGHESKNA